MRKRRWAAVAGVSAFASATGGVFGNHLPWPAVLDRNPQWITAIFAGLTLLMVTTAVALYRADGHAAEQPAAAASFRDATAEAQETSIAVAGDISVGPGGTLVLTAGRPPDTDVPVRRPLRDRAFSVPRPGDSRPFAGRADELAWVHQALRGDGAVAAITQTRAITGLGGVGKSRLAREYALRHRSDYDVVWWVRAEAGATRDTDFAALARELGLVDEDASPQDAVAATSEWLANHGRWLLVFDNAESPDDVLDLLPAAAEGHVLVTTRRAAEWQAVSPALHLDVLKRTDSVALLTARSSDDDAGSAGELAEVLGDLPLALEQAAAYCRATRVGLAGYLHRYRLRAPDLLAEGPPVDYPATVATTWSLAMDAVRTDSPDAGALLALCSLLAPDGIPRDLLRAVPEGWGEKVPAVRRLADPFVMDRAVAALARYSLADATDTTITVHRLVQQVTRQRLDPAQRETFAAMLLHTVAAEFPDARLMPAWPAAIALLPHAAAVLDATHDDSRTAPARASLLSNVGVALGVLGHREPALAAIEEAVTHYRDLAATQPVTYRPDLATSLNNLATVLRALGRREAALAAIDEAVTHYRALATTQPDTRPHLATSLNTLSNVLAGLGRREAALAAIDEAVTHDRDLAAAHPDAYRPNLAASLNNLSNVLRGLGRREAALAAIDEAVTHYRDLAAAHPDAYRPNLAMSLNNLSNVLDGLGRREAALAAVEE